jgi:hypothetical protein
MISVIPNPALEALVAQVAPELVFGQVLVERHGLGFTLRHEADRGVAGLRTVGIQELREIAQSTERGQFRPLKSAPSLRRGWQCQARDASELDAALRRLYPGAVADWFAAKQPVPPVAHYRDYTARQTGMYRITTMLNDTQVAQVARAGCHREFCLKQRLWTVGGLPPDQRADKSELACLEPCAVLMEFARAVMRIEQQSSETVTMSGSVAPPDGIREGDFSSPLNPRLVQWRLEKSKSASAGKVD